MIREEIKKQAEIYTDDVSNYTEWTDDGGWTDYNAAKFVEKAFIKGAKWADANPKYHWISVKDELPYYHKELIQYHLGKPKTVEVVVKDRFSLSIDYMLLDNERWQWMRNFGVTHWMPIPEPPKK